MRVERWLTAAMLAAVAGVAWLESRAPLAETLRTRKPWTLWVAFEAVPEPPRLYLAILRPEARTADLVYVPGDAKAADGRPISAARADALGNDADPAGAAKDEADAAREALSAALGEAASSDRFVYAEAAPGGAPDEALEGARRLAALPARLAFGRSGLRTNLGRVDRLLAALELAHARGDRLRPAWLPEDAHDRRAALGRLLAGTPAPAPAQLAIEVLNASGKRGIALGATKVLRLGGADVVSSGNAPRPQDRTVVYDRAGRFENALAVRRMLGCRSAAPVSQVSAKRLVDVSVVLADDCASER